VPQISRFYGITISMYYDERPHPGRAHFHAQYGEFEASLDIETLALIAGELPRPALRLVLEWAHEHRTELEANWERAREFMPLMPIEPLG
jgi:hypothetical protein